MSLSAELQRLHDLKDRGALTDQEYDQAKAELLSGQSSAGDSTSPTSTGFSLKGITPNQWAMLLHFSQFAGYVAPLAGFALPVLLWQLKKEDTPGLDAHGKMVTNWIISSAIYGAICGVFLCVYVGFLGLIPLMIMGVVFPIIGGIRANEGILWKYPLTIRFLS